MALIVGLDTGGTFTDAALVDTESGTLLAKAKSLTTRHDLAIGVGGAMAAVLSEWGGTQRISRSYLCQPPWRQMPWWKGWAAVLASS